MFLLIVFFIIDLFDWKRIFNCYVKCSRCGCRIKISEAYELLHGMGLESINWVEYFCIDHKPKETLLTKHIIAAPTIDD